MSDSLKKCAKNFAKNAKYNYMFVIGKKNKQKFEVDTKCLKEDFTHIVGLDHLKDIDTFDTHNSRIKNSNFQKIIKGNITLQDLRTQSAIFSEPIVASYNSHTKTEYTLEERIEKLSNIEQHLTNAYKGTLFKWDISKCDIHLPNGKRRYCKIQADYLLVVPSPDNKDENIYYFMVTDNKKTNSNDNIIRLKVHSAFPDCVKIENGQEKTYTILEETKINHATKTRLILYTHPSYKKEKDALLSAKRISSTSSLDRFTENVHKISNDTICENADALLDLYTLSKQESISNLAIFNKAHDNDMEFGSFAVFKDINSRAELKYAYDKLNHNAEKPSFDEVYERMNTFIQPFIDKDYEPLLWSPTKSIWERQVDGPDKKSSETKLPPPPPPPPFPPTSSEESSTNNEADTNKPKKDETSSNHLSAKTILLNEAARGVMFPNIKTTTPSDDFTNPYNN